MYTESQNKFLEDKITVMENKIAILKGEHQILAQKIGAIESDLEWFEDQKRQEHEDRLIGETIRQLEKKIVREIFENPPFYSFSKMFKELDKNAEAQKKWELLKKKMNLTQTTITIMQELLQGRITRVHPTTFDGKPITSEYLTTVVAEQVDFEFLQGFLDIVDILNRITPEGHPLFQT